MSYPKDLDQYDESQLTSEIQRRAKARRKGLCDYCKQPVSGSNPSPPCSLPERHRMSRVLFLSSLS